MKKVIIISNDASALRARIEKYASTATVEAEYGDHVVAGTVATLAHHGPRAGQPCPCSMANFPDMGIEAIGISHVDLDTIGGIMALMGQKPSNGWAKDFWAAAAQVDVKGVHKIADIDLGCNPTEVMDSLNAWWAFSESVEGRVFAPRDGSAAEVDLSKHFAVIRAILDEDDPEREGLVQAGRQWAAQKEALEKASYYGTVGAVLVRSSDQFVNHLYAHDGQSYAAVVGYNTKTGAITVSVSDPIEGFSCGEFCRSIWGAEAGGHAGIGGSPRGQQLTLDDAKAVALALAKRLT